MVARVGLLVGLLVALAAIPGSLAARGRYSNACVKRCMDALPDGGFEPVCVVERKGRPATMWPNLCAWKCARNYKKSTRWYDRQPVDCTSRVACSLVYQADMRCKAAWEEAVAGGAARPETNPDCTCSADLPRNKRWFGGSFEPACGKVEANTLLWGKKAYGPDSDIYTEEIKDVTSMDACCQECKDVAACSAYSWDKKGSTCYLRGPNGWERRRKRGVQSARLVDPDARKPGRY